MRDTRIIKIFKIAIGSSIAILLADYFSLAYSTSAGIITLLTIQDTKKETLVVALKRVVSFLVSTCIAFILFQTFMYHPITFGVYLFIFISICRVFKMEDGIAMSAVLTTHYLIEKSMSFDWIKNEIFLMLIGVIIGILLNLYMPRNIKMIHNDQYEIEDKMRVFLDQLASQLFKKDWNQTNEISAEETSTITQESFLELEAYIKKAIQRAYENMNNNLLSDTRYYIGYMEVRKNQCKVLENIYKQIGKLTFIPVQAHLIAELMMNTALSFHEYNNAVELINQLDIIKYKLKEDELPLSREEFENRAVLYHILNDLELFLIMKRDFTLSLTKKQIATYWKTTGED